MKPSELRLDHGPRLLGVTERRPRMSWLLPPGSSQQLAYRIEAGSWDSGAVETDRCTYIDFGGEALSSRQQVTWRVKAWTDVGESDWSDPAQWEMGLLEPADWQARFVSPVEDVVGAPGRRPAHVLRRVFEVDGPTTAARLYATAHGIYELFLNGTRVGDLELTPGFTAYRSHLEVQTYDVGALLRPGRNCLEAILSDGWYRGQVGYTREHDAYGDRTALLAQLERTGEDATVQLVVTDGDWEAATGPLVAADLIEGQREDRRLEVGPWRLVEVVDGDLDRLTSSPAPPTRAVEELVPVSVTAVEPARHVVDLGQNINGWIRLTSPIPEGTTVTLSHGERILEDGTVDLEHLRPFALGTTDPLSSGQVDEVIGGRGGEPFEPRHTTHGFEFVQIDGHPGPIGVGDVQGVVVHTDLRRTGWFRCSDERINRLHEAAVWSFRDNACEVPTDCPQRERAGWTGDWQVFAPTAAFLYDVAGFSARWMRDLAADQWPDGRVPNYIPDPGGPAAYDHPMAQFIHGSAGWGDAAVLVPWEMWLAYGDERFLTDCYDAGAGWVEFAERAAKWGRHTTRVAERPEPAPHEAFLWDTGFHWGEWCEPGGNPDGLFTLEMDVADVATAYLHRSSYLLGRMAGVLGRVADEARWLALADGTLDAWRREFIVDGTVRPDTQANLVRALAFGLIPDDLRATAAARLVELIRGAGTHLGTGFLATPHLLPVLVDSGHVDVAYDLLFQDTSPSWLSMIDAGATTIWENWEGVDAGGSGSLNHYSKGAVVGFLHRYTAGIRIDEDGPGYRRFLIQPVPDARLTHAEAALDSPYGPIRSSWSRSGRQVQLELDVPPGTEADVVLPDGASHHAVPGHHSYRWIDGG
jgi:alpha-L-rhamnosidase